MLSGPPFCGPIYEFPLEGKDCDCQALWIVNQVEVVFFPVAAEAEFPNGGIGNSLWRVLLVIRLFSLLIGGGFLWISRKGALFPLE